MLYKYHTFIPPQKLLHVIKHEVCNYPVGPTSYSRIVTDSISAQACKQGWKAKVKAHTHKKHKTRHILFRLSIEDVKSHKTEFVCIFVEDAEEDAQNHWVFVEDAEEDAKTIVFLWKTHKRKKQYNIQYIFY